MQTFEVNNLLSCLERGCIAGKLALGVVAVVGIFLGSD